MQTYRAEITCRVPVGLGFSCDNEDTQSFSYAGAPLTREHAEEVINEEAPACWKCRESSWRVDSLTPITYRASAEVTRT